MEFVPAPMEFAPESKVVVSAPKVVAVASAAETVAAIAARRRARSRRGLKATRGRLRPLDCMDCSSVPPKKNGRFPGNVEARAGGVGPSLGSKMALELGAARIAGGPAQAIGEIGGEAVEVLHDAGECPVGGGRVRRARRRREPRQHNVDAGRLVLAMPFARQAAGEAKAAWSGMRWHDPDDALPRPATAAREKGFGMIEQGRQ